MNSNKLSQVLAGSLVFGMIVFFYCFSWAESLVLKNTTDLPTTAFSKNPGKSPVADQNNDGLSDGLQGKLIDVPPNQLFDVIVTFKGPGSARSAQQAVGGFNVKREFRIVPGFSATMTGAQAKALARAPGVFRVEENFKVYVTLDSANRDFGTDAARQEFLLAGDGIGICVLDTGVDPSHEQLDNGKVAAFQDFVGTQTNAYDDHGHGTHVCSIAAGDGSGGASAPKYAGVAPGAAIYAAKVLDYLGQGNADDVIAGIQWCADRSEVAVISMSLGSTGSSDGNDSISRAVNNAVLNERKIVVVAAGNSGSGPYTIGSPGAADEAITVGAAAEWSAPEGSASHSEGVYLASFSSRGPTADERNKPDVVGPGVSITAAQFNTAAGYITYSGTSMATPFVSGTVALALEADPTLTPEAVKANIVSTAKDCGPAGFDDDWGAGLLDGYAIVSKAAGTTGSNPFPTLQHIQGSVSNNGEWRWSFDVDDLSTPLAVMITSEGQPICPLPDLYCQLGLWPWEWTPDLDAELWGPENTLLATSTCMVGNDCGAFGRQETLHIMPSIAGPYTVVVYPFDGDPNNGKGGNFTVDISTGPLSSGPYPLAETSCSDDIDNDGDGLIDCFDNDCSDDSCCIDGDGDHVADCMDGCPNDSNKAQPGICGCGITDLDSDADGTPDCYDLCPNDPNKVDPENCGCGVAEDECLTDPCGSCFKGKCDGICSKKDGPACPDCASSAFEVCNDQLDNDGDGAIDCDDADCYSNSFCNQNCFPKGSVCSSAIECCSGKCRGGVCR